MKRRPRRLGTLAFFAGTVLAAGGGPAGRPPACGAAEPAGAAFPAPPGGNDPSSPDPGGTAKDLRQAGVRHYEARQYFQAIQALERALQIAKGGEKTEIKDLLARARTGLGVELFNAGETQKAAEAFRAALGDSPYAYAHFGLGLVHFMRLEDAEASEHLAKSLELDPGHAKTHKLLGLIDYRQGRTSEAVEKLEEACRLDPKDTEAKTLFDRWSYEIKVTESFPEKARGRFLVRADPDLPGERVEEVVKRMEKTRKELSASFGLKASRRIPVVLFTPERFHKATGSFHWVGAVFDGQLKLPVPKTESPAEAARFEETLRHDMAHVCVRERLPECPNWLNEGIAQYFERQAEARATRDLLRKGAARKIPFKEVPARLWEVDDEALARWTYLQGLGFVEHLAGRFHEFRLRLLLAAIAREGSLGRGFEVTYGAPLRRSNAPGGPRSSRPADRQTSPVKCRRIRQGRTGVGLFFGAVFL